MTSSALVVLSLALVCSIFGSALEQTFDHGNNSSPHSIMTSILRNHELMHEHQDIDMGTTRTNIADSNYVNAHNNKNYNKGNKRNSVKNTKNAVHYDEIYTAVESKGVNIKKSHGISENYYKEEVNNNVNNNFKIVNKRRQYNKDYLRNNVDKRREKRQIDDDVKCDTFKFKSLSHKSIMHPHSSLSTKNTNYYNSTDCVTVISVNDGQAIELTFVDMFHIEDHPDCAYDYLEIRDGQYGFSKLLGKFCGTTFPQQLKSSSPFLWLKFHSDDTIEYEGFRILIEAKSSSTSHPQPQECYKEMEGTHGIIATQDIPEECKKVQPLDMLWYIKTEENTKIYLNFTTYSLKKPNECEQNLVQVFGSVLEYPAKLAHYCGSMANPVTTKDPEKGSKEVGNVMYVRAFMTKMGEGSNFNATYTAYRTLDTTNGNDVCDPDTEFDCEDNTCIDIKLRCDEYAHCRLKADEDKDLCREETQSMIAQPHIMVILVIFSLILSGMSFVFLFKCIRKLYQDHKIIKEHIRQSCEDRLDTLVASRLTLDAKRLERDSEPRERERASLERENHTNEMFKRQRSNFSQHKPTSIDSDFIAETQLDLDDEPWRREVDQPVPVETAEVRVERNGRSRRSDISRKEESMRKDSRKEEPTRKDSRSVREKIEEDVREKKEIRDVSVGAPDTKESGCQTRESLFQVEGPTSPDGTESGSGSRGFSTFGYSGATIARPSPPAPAPPTSTSQVTIELLRAMPHRQESQTKKLPDRRPMSTETTRSAPDVIIVSKPIR